MHPGQSLSRADHANRFGYTEWAGAFGDLGTLIPFVLAYVTLVDVDPGGILLGFGLALVGAGAYYRTPFPVQPMKAIGAAAATQATHGFVVTPGAVYGAGLATGVFWVFLAATGLAERLARATPRPVVAGLILGLGVTFVVRGVGLMAHGWWLAAGAVGLALLSGRRLPAMFVLLLLGAGAAVVTHPGLAADLAALRPHFSLPPFGPAHISPADLAGGVVFLALPQIPLTLGNAFIAIHEENNRLFPDRPVTERQVAVSTGLMNLASPLVGGVPMCHGAGGMAGHVRFGARTGGAPLILGVLLLVIALFFSDSVTVIFALFPAPVLGVILALAGVQLAAGPRWIGVGYGAATVAVLTAAVALWNVAAAFGVGVTAHRIVFRGTRRH
ncbi:MAG TPA: putative sulfate/molybdate transporter [Gammaproteobacteria bacterium]|nr:putative sulfate/molybdate transporter [Gammaproteobacteria bacterium]